jgi:hypothetical protein
MPIIINITIVDVGIDNTAGIGTTLDGYLQSSTNSYRSIYGGINIEESNTQATLGGQPAYRIVFAPVDGRIKMMEVGTIAGDKIYYLRYIAVTSSYPNNLPDVLNMISSLAINR